MGPLRHLLRTFKDTLTRGHYNGAGHSAADLLDSKPAGASAEEKAASASMNLAFMIGSDVVLGAVAALTSLGFLAVASVGIGVVGTFLFGREFLRCQKLAQERIRETNLAGQRVMGTRADLYDLHTAQNKIVDLAVAFGNAKGAGLKETIDDDINAIIQTVDKARHRVAILDEGTHHASKKEYDFVRPSLHVVHKAKAAA